MTITAGQLAISELPSRPIKGSEVGLAEDLCLLLCSN